MVKDTVTDEGSSELVEYLQSVQDGTWILFGAKSEASSKLSDEAKAWDGKITFCKLSWVKHGETKLDTKWYQSYLQRPTNIGSSRDWLVGG